MSRRCTCSFFMKEQRKLFGIHLGGRGESSVKSINSIKMSSMSEGGRMLRIGIHALTI